MENDQFDFKEKLSFYIFLLAALIFVSLSTLYLVSCAPKYDEPCLKIFVEQDGELYPVNEQMLLPPL
jgi:hypothetical protein